MPDPLALKSALEDERREVRRLRAALGELIGFYGPEANYTAVEGIWAEGGSTSYGKRVAVMVDRGALARKHEGLL